MSYRDQVGLDWSLCKWDGGEKIEAPKPVEVNWRDYKENFSPDVYDRFDSESVGIGMYGMPKRKVPKIWGIKLKPNWLEEMPLLEKLYELSNPLKAKYDDQILGWFDAVKPQATILDAMMPSYLDDAARLAAGMKSVGCDFEDANVSNVTTIALENGDLMQFESAWPLKQAVSDYTYPSADVVLLKFSHEEQIRRLAKALREAIDLLNQKIEELPK